MSKITTSIVFSMALSLSLVVQVVYADTKPLGENQDIEVISDEYREKYRLAVDNVNTLIETSQTKAARKAFKNLKKEFPEIAGEDFDLFVKAELLYCKGKYAKASMRYDKLLNDYPDSGFYDTALKRQFTVGKAFLAGRKKKVLGFLKISGHAEGVKILDRISDRTGLDDPNGLGLKAAVAVARHYEQRKKYNESYLKWSEIYSHWQIGPVGKEALLSMARCKHAAYNKQPEHKRHLFDASRLSTAKSYYEKFKLLYPSDSEKLGIDGIMKQIDEELARKNLSIALYYQKTGKKRAANLYYDMVIQNWPDTEAAQTAKQLSGLTETPNNENRDEAKP